MSVWVRACVHVLVGGTHQCMLGVGAIGVCVCACTCAWVRASVLVGVRARACACVGGGGLFSGGSHKAGVRGQFRAVVFFWVHLSEHPASLLLSSA